MVAINSLLRGLEKLELNEIRLNQDLNDSWEVLTEAIQTLIRKNNIPNGYELMKNLSRGKSLKEKDLLAFVNTLNLPPEDKKRLMELTPNSYTGYAAKLSKES